MIPLLCIIKKAFIQSLFYYFFILFETLFQIFTDRLDTWCTIQFNELHLSAQRKLEQGRRSNPLDALLRAKLKFLKMYFLRLGFLDGAKGFRLCLDSAWGIWYKYHRLWQLGK